MDLTQLDLFECDSCKTVVAMVKRTENEEPLVDGHCANCLDKLYKAKEAQMRAFKEEVQREVELFRAELEKNINSMATVVNQERLAGNMQRANDVVGKLGVLKLVYSELINHTLWLKRM